jgi:hypothetical protein
MFFYALGFSKSKVAIGFKPGIIYQMIDIYYFFHAYILSLSIIIYKYFFQ